MNMPKWLNNFLNRRKQKREDAMTIDEKWRKIWEDRLGYRK